MGAGVTAAVRAPSANVRRGPTARREVSSPRCAYELLSAPATFFPIFTFNSSNPHNYLPMRRVTFKYGIQLFALLGALFTAALLAGFIEHTGLRVLNGIFHVGIVYLAVRSYRRRRPDRWNYLTGFGAGVAAGMFGTVLFCILVALVLAGNPELMDAVTAGTRVGNYLNPITAALVLALEGFLVTFFASYASMRVVDSDRSFSPAGRRLVLTSRTVR